MLIIGIYQNSHFNKFLEIFKKDLRKNLVGGRRLSIQKHLIY